jgi:hypothetical protein
MTQEGCFRSWRDNREGGIDGWKSPIFSITTEDLLEERAASKKKDVWQTITWTFDPRHPERGLKEEKLTPHESIRFG